LFIIIYLAGVTDEIINRASVSTECSDYCDTVLVITAECSVKELFSYSLHFHSLFLSTCTNFNEVLLEMMTMMKRIMEKAEKQQFTKNKNGE
jgi:hypothetical protein